MGIIRECWSWLADEERQTRGVRALQLALGSALLFRVFTEARFAPFLWGPKGVGWGRMSDLFGPTGGLLDLAFASDAGTYGLLLALTLGALGLVFGYRTRLATALALVPFFLLEQRLPEMGDGGDNVAQLVLVYMLFLRPAGRPAARGSLGVWAHNVAVLAIALQVFVLYVTSGMMKAYGEHWHHGVAMYYVSQVEWFSLPAMRAAFRNPLVVTLATYVPMFYQIMFPLAMASRVKLPWLFFGVAFHLGVAVFMGLVTFSTVMIGLELFLISDPEYANVEARTRAALSRLRRFLRPAAFAPTDSRPLAEEAEAAQPIGE